MNYFCETIPYKRIKIIEVKGGGFGRGPTLKVSSNSRNQKQIVSSESLMHTQTGEML